MSKDCKREPFPPLVPGPDPCAPPPPPPGPCGCGPWPYMSSPSPVLSVPGNSLYDSMMCLNQKVDTCIRAYNDVIARGYETLRNMEGANEAQGSFYNNKEITPISGYSPTDSSAYQLYKKQVLDCEGQPIRMEFRYGYDNVTNNGVKEGIFDAGRMVDADIIFPCQPDGDKVTGILYFKGKPVEGQIDPGFQHGFTVGFSRAGVMRVYPNTTDPHQLFLDEIENSAGCAGVLILEGKKVSAEMIEAIPDSAETRQRVCIGQNGYTREVYILTCKDEDTVPGQVGLTSDECANILLERGCTIAVEIAENNTGVLVNKGQLYQGSLDLSALNFNGFWYISKRCRYRNDYQSELANLYYDFGESLNNFRLQTSELKNIYDQLNQETQDRIAADNALSERIDDLTGRIDGLIDEMKNYTDNQIAALTLRLTDKTLLLPYVQKSGDSMQGPLDMGDNKITSSYVPVEDADITNKKFVDDAIAAQHEVDANQFVDVSGDTMTGPLAMGAQKITSSYNPQDGEDLTNKAYVDAGLNEKLSLSGGTMTGNILMGGNKVVSSAVPVSGDDLTNKDYVDTAIGNQHTADAEQFVDVAGDTMTGALDMGVNKVTSSYTPTDDNDLTNKTFVDTELSKQKSELEGEIAQAIENVTNGTTPISGVVKTDGSTPLTATWNAGQKITGIPTPTENSDVANKEYVDAHAGGGGDVTAAGNNTFTGNNTFNNPVTVGSPTENAHAATKEYVDDAVSGVQVEGVVKTDGSTPLTDNWDAGNFGIYANNFRTPVSNNTYSQLMQDPDNDQEQFLQFVKGGNAYAAIVGDGTDNSIGVYVNRTKGALKSLSVGTPTENNHAATKAYVDSRPGGGGGDVTQAGNNTFTGQNTFNNPVTVGTPTADAHAATKKYTDDLNTAMGTRVSGLETEVDGLAAEIEGIDPAGLLKADGSVALTKSWDIGNHSVNFGSTSNRLTCSPGRIGIMVGGSNKLIISGSTSYSYITLFNGVDNAYLTAINGEIGFSLNNNLSNPIPINVGTPVNATHAVNKGYFDTNTGLISVNFNVTVGTINSTTPNLNVIKVNNCYKLVGRIRIDNLNNIEIITFSYSGNISVLPCCAIVTSVKPPHTVNTIGYLSSVGAGSISFIFRERITGNVYFYF